VLVDDDYLSATESEPPMDLPVLQVLIHSLPGESRVMMISSDGEMAPAVAVR
jgi:hypothetical protein